MARRSRSLGRIPAVVAPGILGLALAGTAPAAAGASHDEMDVPSYAGAEKDPDVGHAQKFQVGREVVDASLFELLTRPLRSTSRFAGRTAERLGVRARSLAGIVGPAGPSCAHGDHPDDLGGTSGTVATTARLTLHTSSEASIQALYRHLATATRRVDLMMYGWQDDPTGREAAGALALAAGRGVRVRVMVDRTSMLIHNPAAASGCATFLDALRRVPNVAVIETPPACLSFDHRKLAVVDGRVAWSGGMILTDSARRRWHNLAFTAEGPVVAQYACVFEEAWREAGGRPEGPDDVLADTRIGMPNAGVRLVQTNVGDRSLRDAIYHAVDHARRHIYLENPYFTDEILAAKLGTARARGVDVRAVLTVRGNIPRLNRYATVTANRLLRSGVRVYLYPGMTHVKAMSADGVWAYMGSGNLDALSLRNNREVALSVTSPEIASDLDRRLFLPDMAVSQELTAPLPPPGDRLELELFSLWY